MKIRLLIFFIVKIQTLYDFCNQPSTNGLKLFYDCNLVFFLQHSDSYNASLTKLCLWFYWFFSHWPRGIIKIKIFRLKTFANWYCIKFIKIVELLATWVTFTFLCDKVVKGMQYVLHFQHEINFQYKLFSRYCIKYQIPVINILKILDTTFTDQKQRLIKIF